MTLRFSLDFDADDSTRSDYLKLSLRHNMSDSALLVFHALYFDHLKLHPQLSAQRAQPATQLELKGIL